MSTVPSETISVSRPPLGVARGPLSRELDRRVADPPPSGFPAPPPHGGASIQTIMAEVAKALQGLRYGEVTILVREGAVVRIERTEKSRPYRADL